MGHVQTRHWGSLDASFVQNNMVMVMMRNVRHVLRTTLFMMEDVWDVYQWRCVLSTTVMWLIVLINIPHISHHKQCGPQGMSHISQHHHHVDLNKWNIQTPSMSCLNMSHLDISLDLCPRWFLHLNWDKKGVVIEWGSCYQGICGFCDGWWMI